MKKRMLIAGILCTMMLALAGAKEKEELSDAGKSGAIIVKIEKHLTVTSIDGQPTKLKNKIMLDAGEHIIEFNYYHLTPSYEAKGFARTSFNFEEGKKYVYKSVENLENGGSLYVVLRDESMQTIEDNFYSSKKIDDPETNNGAKIEFLEKIPEGKKYKYVGNVVYDIKVSPYVWKSINLERAYLYYKEFLYQNGIDAVIENAINNRVVTYPGFTFSGIGIKYIDDEETVEEK